VITISRYPWLDSHFIKIIANSFVDKMREISQSFEAPLFIWRGKSGAIKICYSYLKSATCNLQDLYLLWSHNNTEMTMLWNED